MLWPRINEGNKSGNCLITIRTGSILDEDGIGLVGNHAYAVLEVVEL